MLEFKTGGLSPEEAAIRGSLTSISRRGWLKLARWTVCGTLGCMAISITFNALAFYGMEPDAYRMGLFTAAVIPIVLAGPLFFYLTLKLRELAIANHRIAMAASIDSLTAVLNRGAFSAGVQTLLDARDRGHRFSAGAFLMIDADHFKAINDRFGHGEGDEALRIIAAAIRTAVRKDDLVGRLGGEEFGVFLPGATAENAAAVAERIRSVVADTVFVPNGQPHRLTVSVGGVAFDYWRDRALPELRDLFRSADERLYGAKHAGRNRTSIGPLAEPTGDRRSASALH